MVQTAVALLMLKMQKLLYLELMLQDHGVSQSSNYNDQLNIDPPPPNFWCTGLSLNSAPFG
jgi:hypothetical protein